VVRVQAGKGAQYSGIACGNIALAGSEFRLLSRGWQPLIQGPDSAVNSSSRAMASRYEMLLESVPYSLGHHGTL